MEIGELNSKSDNTNDEEHGEFVTVVAVGAEKSLRDSNRMTTIMTQGSDGEKDYPGYVMVLKIGEDESLQDIVEEVLVYRLPGERLGFGLKFEGGTKAAEFVKRLFIQSCAPDSPASRVRCSWGTLKVDDEVLEIDSMPVKTMTRIDCVRRLKDSNVVIKLLVKHCATKGSDEGSTELDIIPSVVSAEKKRSPPPVPPRKIPRRSIKNQSNIVIPPKVFVDIANDSLENATMSSVKLSNGEITANGAKSQKQSSRNNSKNLSKQSPEFHKHERRPLSSTFSPPDAEVYMDLFSQESVYSLSESDDTGSTISTVVDRFSSYPTTTNSSFSGSLPSTPTAVQRHLDLSNSNPFDKDDADDLITNENGFRNTINGNHVEEDGLTNGDILRTSKVGEENGTLQPPVSFQDAPLSYGNEDLRSIQTSMEVVENNIYKSETNNFNGHKAPSNDVEPKRPPPRTRCFSEKNNNSYMVKTLNHSGDPSVSKLKDSNLPRLVDFVPKSNKNAHNDEITESICLLKMFIENEKRNACNVALAKIECEELKENYDRNCIMSVTVPEIWTENDDFYTFNWNPTSHLATIGEDEEEGTQDWNSASTPIVIVENVDGCEDEECGIVEKVQKPLVYDVPDGIAANNTNTDDENRRQIMDSENVEENSPNLPITSDTNGIMEVPSINSRQPPDGHEFPDYQEASTLLNSHKIRDEDLKVNNIVQKCNSFSDIPPHLKNQQITNISDKIAKFSSSPAETSNLTNTFHKSAESCYFSNVSMSDNNNLNKPLSKSAMSINNISSLNDKSDCYQTRNITDCSLNLQTTQPRIHVRSQSLIDIKSDRWSALMEQRRRGLSKLKGLVIPEHISEVEHTVDLPVIKSNNASTLSFSEMTPEIYKSPKTPNNRYFSTSSSSPVSPPWIATPVTQYSQTFKHKNLQLSNLKRNDGDKNESPKIDVTPTNLSFVNDAPKSLESITSPTRSDSSFEYITSTSPDFKITKLDINNRILQNVRTTRNTKEDIGKSEEDESDNDSAVSSSQSSYISRSPPPTSPNQHLHLSFSSKNCDTLLNHNNVELKDDFDSLSRRRLLKAKSVEAINRKNILASAKCRSGQDLKVGSPRIQRKFDEDVKTTSPCANNENVVNEIPTENAKLATQTHVITQSINKVTENKPNNKTEEVETDKNGRNSKLTDETDSKLVISQSLDDGANRPQKEITLNNVILRQTNRNLNKHEEPIISRARCVRNVKATSVTDLRKNFEKLTPVRITAPIKQHNIQLKNINRLSLNLPTKDEIIPLIKTAPVKSEDFKPIYVQKQDSQKLIEDTLRNLEESIPEKDIKVIILKPEMLGGSIGITLAGGIDYETKSITVHRVRPGSLAYKDGRLERGDRILSINGKIMKGLTHTQSISILKEPVNEITIVVCKSKEPCTPSSTVSPQKRNSIHQNLLSPVTSPIKVATEISPLQNQGNILEVTLNKDITGLGFSVEGGIDSPMGNVPLVIKKVFRGGAAEKCEQLKAGDELLEINKTDVSKMSRIDAWTMMKKLPEGAVQIKIRR